MYKSEELKFDLECLSDLHDIDLDGAEFDVPVSDNKGNEGVITRCVQDVANEALKRILALEDVLQMYACYATKEAMERDIRVLTEMRDDI